MAKRGTMDQLKSTPSLVFQLSSYVSIKGWQILVPTFGRSQCQEEKLHRSGWSEFHLMRSSHWSYFSYSTSPLHFFYLISQLQWQRNWRKYQDISFGDIEDKKKSNWSNDKRLSQKNGDWGSVGYVTETGPFSTNSESFERKTCHGGSLLINTGRERGGGVRVVSQGLGHQAYEVQIHSFGNDSPRVGKSTIKGVKFQVGAVK